MAKRAIQERRGKKSPSLERMGVGYLNSRPRGKVLPGKTLNTSDEGASVCLGKCLVDGKRGKKKICSNRGVGGIAGTNKGGEVTGEDGSSVMPGGKEGTEQKIKRATPSR